MFLERKTQEQKRDKIFKRNTSAIYVNVAGDSCFVFILLNVHVFFIFVMTSETNYCFHFN